MSYIKKEPLCAWLSNMCISENIIKAIESDSKFPPADVVEVIHAQWIKHIDPLEWCEDDVDVYYECSNCGCNNYGESPYCPDCGAKMDVAWINGDYEF